MAGSGRERPAATGRRPGHRVPRRIPGTREVPSYAVPRAGPFFWPFPTTAYRGGYAGASAPRPRYPGGGAGARCPGRINPLEFKRKLRGTRRHSSPPGEGGSGGNRVILMARSMTKMTRRNCPPWMNMVNLHCEIISFIKHLKQFCALHWVGGCGITGWFHK